MATKSINPTICFKNYMSVQIRYLRFICRIKHIDMLDAISIYGFRFRSLFAAKHGNEIF